MMLSQPYQMPATTLNSMPQPQPVVNQSASNSQIYQDSSDSSDNDGRQTYTNSLVTPSFAYLNPMFITQQGPNISHVSSKLQRKIQQNQYIDLAKLYRHDNPFEKEPVFTIMKNGHLKILSQPKNNDIYSFSRFLDCFMIYMTIRGKSHPQEYPGMLRYVEIVKNLFAQHCDGISYDRRFRMMRADNPNMPWSCYIPWPISVTHAIITTGHPIFTICQNMLCYYQRDSSYYHMPHAIINTIHAIINKILYYYHLPNAIINNMRLLSTNSR